MAPSRLVWPSFSRVPLRSVLLWVSTIPTLVEVRSLGMRSEKGDRVLNSCRVLQALMSQAVQVP